MLGRSDDLASAFMTIGSPALAAYSLAITGLNTEWLTRQFSSLHFPNKERIPPVIAALQQIPFRIDASGSSLPSMIVLPQNDHYWELLLAAVKRNRQDTIPVALGFTWVIVALLITFLDSSLAFDHFISTPGAAGYSIVAVWSFLMPLVYGWLSTGYQREANYLRDVLDGAHGIAYVATTAGSVPAARVTGRSTRGIEPSTGHIDYVNADEKKTAPVFNYSRVFIWSQHAEHILRLFEHAANRADRRITVGRGRAWTGNDDGGILAHNRVGNEAEVVQYCMGEPGAPFDPNGRRHDEGAAMEAHVVPGKPIFATEVFQRAACATVLGLGLQWFTTGAAIHVHLKTPPKGMGCRALTFTVYGAAATVAFWILLFSSVLAHWARRQSTRERRSALKTFVGCIAAIMRWLGKFIAITNGVGILALSVMQFTGLYDTCFCSSTVFGGDPDGVVRFMEDITRSEVYGPWNFALGMAFAVNIFYAGLVATGTGALMKGVQSFCRGLITLFTTRSK